MQFQRDRQRHGPLNHRGALALFALIALVAGCNRQADGESKETSSRANAQSPQPAPAAAAPPPTQAVQPGVTTPPGTAPPPPAAQTPARPQTALPVKALTDLESLVAPIALYPDQLLAEMLVASTYPFEVVQAARWLQTGPDPATLKTKDWDASIQRLTEVPSVIKMMNDHLDWTTQLGDTFLAKPNEVMAAVQALRKRATDGGFLKDTPEQKVIKKAAASAPEQTGEWVSAEPGTTPEGTTGKAQPAVMKTETIYIQPAQTDKIYVPQYNPETVYSATMAPPPSGGAQYPATTAGYTYPSATTSNYYPTSYPPATTTTTTSGYDQALTFGAGALVGGLLTWAIIEATDDDYDDWHGYPIAYPHGGAVCRNGNCWYGGGGYGGNTYVDRGYTKNVNISGNEINIDRDGTFRQNDLARIRQPTPWTPDARHRRGEQFPAEAQKRLGQIQSPALAGQRLGAAETLPATSRGFAQEGGLPTARRPSTAEIREGLAQRPGGEGKPGLKAPEQRPSARDVRDQLGQTPRQSALDGVGERGQQARIESRRGAESRRQIPAQAREKIQPQHRAQIRETPKALERPGAGLTQRAERSPIGGGERTRAQALDFQRRSEAARPSAFEGLRDTGRTQAFGQRGATSRQEGRAGGFGAGAGGARSGGAAIGGRRESSGGGSGPRGGGGVRPGGGGGGLRGGGGGFRR